MKISRIIILRWLIGMILTRVAPDTGFEPVTK